MIQEARPGLVHFHVAAALDSFPVFWVHPLGLLVVASAYWDSSLLLGCSRPFLRLGICVFSLGGSWCFLRLEIFIFLLGFLKVFRNFNVRVWRVSCVIGLDSLVRAFFFLFFSCPTDPSLSTGPGVVPFCSSVCSSSVPPTLPLSTGSWSG